MIMPYLFTVHNEPCCVFKTAKSITGEALAASAKEEGFIIMPPSNIDEIISILELRGHAYFGVLMDGSISLKCKLTPIAIIK